MNFAPLALAAFSLAASAATPEAQFPGAQPAKQLSQLQAQAGALEQRVAQQETFAGFQPTSVASRDNGRALVIEGRLNRSVTAVVRLDRAFESPSFGRLLITTKLWNRPADAERPMTDEERAAFTAALRRALAQTPPAPQDAPLYEDLLGAGPLEYGHDLGRLEKPGETLGGQERQGSMRGGFTLRWHTHENQIHGSQGIEAVPAASASVRRRVLTTTDREGGRVLVEYVVTLAPDVPLGRRVEIRVEGNHQVRNDPAWNFSFTLTPYPPIPSRP